MKYSSLLVGAAAIAALALTPAFAQTATTSGPRAAITQQQMNAASTSKSMRSATQHGTMQGMQGKQGQCMQCKMSKMSNMPKDMIRRGTILMNLNLNPADPAALLAARRDLQLTDSQVKDLRAIQRNGEIEARGVLTKEQRSELKPIAKAPKNSNEMHEQMACMMHHNGTMQRNMNVQPSSGHMIRYKRSAAQAERKTNNQ